jgi:hypothetical protein
LQEYPVPPEEPPYNPVARHREETPEGIQAETPEGIQVETREGIQAKIPELGEVQRQEDKPLMDYEPWVNSLASLTETAPMPNDS